MKSQTYEDIRTFTIHLLGERGAYDYETGLNYRQIVEGIMTAPPEVMGQLGIKHIKKARYSPNRLGLTLKKPSNVVSENQYCPAIKDTQTRYYLKEECEAK